MYNSHDEYSSFEIAYDGSYRPGDGGAARRCGLGPNTLCMRAVKSVALALAIGLLAALVGVTLQLRHDIHVLQRYSGVPDSAFDDDVVDRHEKVRRAIASEVKFAIDESVDPCADFYTYACGNWLRTAHIPDDRTRWARSFSTIQQRNEEMLRGVLESGWPVIGPLYESCMNTTLVNRRSTSPLEQMLHTISDLGSEVNMERLMQVAAELHAQGVGVLFSAAVDVDAREPTKHVMHFAQGGLGLPDRDYYLEAQHAHIRDQYQEHIQRMLALLGENENDSRRHATQVFGIEYQLANASMARDALRDPVKRYNAMTLDELHALSGKFFPWTAYLEAMGVERPAHTLEKVVVMTPSFFTALHGIVRGMNSEALMAYMRWHLIHGMSSLLHSDVTDETFRFYGVVMGGQKKQAPRWRKCVSLASHGLRDIAARYYVEQAFHGDSRTIARDMVQRVEDAFRSRLRGVEWLDDTTKVRALQKLGQVENKIGYPDRWESYDAVHMTNDKLFENGVGVRGWHFADNVKRLGKPVDKSEWAMGAFTVNAYYAPEFNEMVFPAGILQPPFFNHSFPAAMNYGGIGMVIGHELTHGFDDEGRQYDAKGGLHDWWGAESVKRFNELTKCVEDQYSVYEVQEGVHLNGKLTLGENLADMGGIKLAHDAFRGWVRDHGRDELLLEELDDDQLFFVSFAQSWCQLSTPETERVMVKVDPHSPPKFRVNGVLSNYDEFHKAFQCTEGSRMHPDKQCAVW